MCTVIIEVPEQPENATRLLAIRDEHPDRPWDPPGRWWPETRPEVSGVRDRLAGGAWLAFDESGSLSVILNRGESVAAQLADDAPPLNSRGAIVLDSITKKELSERPNTESFNLVEVRGPHTTVTSWNGTELQRTELSPGLHMVAHGSVNSAENERINTWLPQFRRLVGIDDTLWRDAWVELLTESAKLQPGDDRAMLRDNTPHGIPTQSLLVCLAEIGSTQVEVSSATLKDPSIWAGEAFIHST